MDKSEFSGCAPTTGARPQHLLEMLEQAARQVIAQPLSLRLAGWSALSRHFVFSGGHSMSHRMLLAVTAAAAFIVSTALPAEAKCTRLGFSVNDYGKDGPTADAKKLLDKHIASWATERGIKKYRTGQKTVNCELFLDFIVFDEHTCRAEADVCWNEKDAPKETAAQNSGASITTGSVKKLDPAR